jgi:hypothetical protein
MTTTKVVYVVAAIVPFGLVALACVGILHVAITGLRERRLRRQAQSASQPSPATPGRFQRAEQV